MNIILEGPDGSGKSYLADHILSYLRFQGYRDWRILHSGGPAKSLEEVNARAGQYLDAVRVVFDRHPCVSNPIYSSLFHGIGGPDPAVLDKFYAQWNVLVYCRATDPSRHVVKPDDKASAFITQLEACYGDLVQAYDRWALERAHVVYRIGDSLDATVRSILGRARCLGGGA